MYFAEYQVNKENNTLKLSLLFHPEIHMFRWKTVYAAVMTWFEGPKVCVLLFVIEQNQILS